MTGWTTTTTTDSEGKKNIKLEVDWSNNNDCFANYNNKALHAIFNRCDAEHIKLISSCETAKEAWEILQTTFEGLVMLKGIKSYLLPLVLKN